MLWTLKEWGYDYDVIRLDPFKGETQTREFTDLNPSRKVPVLVHGDEVLTESLPIMEYLNNLSVKNSLIPREPKNIFKYRKIIHYGLTEIEPYLWLVEQANRLKMIYNWPDGTYEEAIETVKHNIAATWQWMNGTNHIAGESFSLADIYYYHLITWSTQHKIDRPSLVTEYLHKLEKRSAFPAAMLPIQQENQEQRPPG